MIRLVWSCVDENQSRFAQKNRAARSNRVAKEGVMRNPSRILK